MKHSSLQILALATDYDDTLAEKGRIAPRTVAALERFKNSGRNLILVTGRQLDDLLEVCPQIGTFDVVVAENGALLYRPVDGETKSLAGPPPVDFLQRLRELDVKPLAAGRSVIATTRPNYDVVRRAILEIRLEMEIIFNRDAVMVLPSGIDKSSGLSVALEQLGVPASHVVGIGDAENDRAFLTICGYHAVVANALPELKEDANWITQASHGHGGTELRNNILAGNFPPPRVLKGQGFSRAEKNQ